MKRANSVITINNPQTKKIISGDIIEFGAEKVHLQLTKQRNNLEIHDDK